MNFLYLEMQSSSEKTENPIAVFLKPVSRSQTQPLQYHLEHTATGIKKSHRQDG